MGDKKQQTAHYRFEVHDEVYGGESYDVSLSDGSIKMTLNDNPYSPLEDDAKIMMPMAQMIEAWQKADYDAIQNKRRSEQAAQTGPCSVGETRTDNE